MCLRVVLLYDLGDVIKCDIHKTTICTYDLQNSLFLKAI